MICRQCRPNIRTISTRSIESTWMKSTRSLAFTRSLASIDHSDYSTSVPLLSTSVPLLSTSVPLLSTSIPLLSTSVSPLSPFVSLLRTSILLILLSICVVIIYALVIALVYSNLRYRGALLNARITARDDDDDDRGQTIALRNRHPSANILANRVSANYDHYAIFYGRRKFFDRMLQPDTVNSMAPPSPPPPPGQTYARAAADYSPDPNSPTPMSSPMSAMELVWEAAPRRRTCDLWAKSLLTSRTAHQV